MKPQEIQPDEWRELSELDEVRDGWGLEPDEGPEFLSQIVYGVRFDYVTDGPGYAGPLYPLQGGGGPETPPMAVIRRERRLEVVAQDL